MRLRYPWSVLDISPTDDEAAIRKAYSIKLRVTRPDEDPKGFQELREARDAAFAESRYMDKSNDGAEEPIDALVEPESASRTMNDEAPEAPPSEIVRSNEVGIIELGPDAQNDPIDATGALTAEVVPEIAELLDQLGRPNPWMDLGAQWARVFDAMEADALSNHGYNMWTVLQRLSDDIKRDAGQLPDVSDWGFDPRGSGPRLLGDYTKILRDLDNRFGILKQDTVLLEYLGEDEARDFINALTIAVGREAMPQPSIRPVINVQPIPAHFAEAAWKDEPAMLDYYRRAYEKDAFPWSFSWLALLFPLPVALYYRLNGLAALVGLLVVANTAFHVMKVRGMDVPFSPMASTVYLVVAGAFAFNWRRIRVHALISRLQRLTDQGNSRRAILDRLTRSSEPNFFGMLLGIAVLIFVALIRFDGGR